MVAQEFSLKETACQLRAPDSLSVCHGHGWEKLHGLARLEPLPRPPLQLIIVVPYILPLFVPLGIAFWWVKNRYLTTSR